MISRFTSFVLVFAVVVASACKKSPATTTDAAADAWTLQPMADEPQQEAAAPLPPNPTPFVMGYTEKDDLPESAGHGRCPPLAEGAKPIPVSVFLEHRATPSPTIDLVIPSLHVRKRLWADWKREAVENPYSCHTTFTTQNLQWNCSEVMTGEGGKIYARGSDIVAGKRDLRNALTHDRYELPCDKVARFEPIVCPARCKSFEKTECGCSELDSDFYGKAGKPRPNAPSPTSTN